MRRTGRLPLAAVVLALALGPAAGRAAGEMETEYVGLELYPLVLDFVEGPPNTHAAASVGAQLGFRVWTMRWSLATSRSLSLSFALTPFEVVGGAFFVPFGYQFYAGVAPGLTLALGEDRRTQLDLSLGFGYGLGSVPEPDRNAADCDGFCGASFSGPAAAPALRLRVRIPNSLTIGLGVRPIIPLENQGGGPWGATLNFFLDLGMAQELQTGPYVESPERPPLTAEAKWGHAAFWTGLALASFGGVATWQSMVAGEDAHRDDSRAWAGGMYAGFLTGGALMIAGIVLWAISPDSEILAPGGEVE